MESTAKPVVTTVIRSAKHMIESSSLGSLSPWIMHMIASDGSVEHIRSAIVAFECNHYHTTVVTRRRPPELYRHRFVNTFSKAARPQVKLFASSCFLHPLRHISPILLGRVNDHVTVFRSRIAFWIKVIHLSSPWTDGVLQEIGSWLNQVEVFCPLLAFWMRVSHLFSP